MGVCSVYLDAVVNSGGPVVSSCRLDETHRCLTSRLDRGTLSGRKVVERHAVVLALCWGW